MDFCPDPPEPRTPDTVTLTCRECADEREFPTEGARLPAPCGLPDDELGPCPGVYTEAMLEQAVQDWRDAQRDPANR